MLCLCENGEVYFDVTTLHSLATTTLNLARLKKINDAPFGGKKVVQASLQDVISAVLLKTGEVYTWANLEEMVPWAMAIRVSKASQS